MSREMAGMWAQLVAAGLAEGAMPEKAAHQTPWYVRGILGFSGWLAALFLLGFVGVGLEFIVKSAIVSMAVGAGCLVAAFFQFRAARNDFLTQFALAVSFAGQGLIVVGLLEVAGWRGGGLWWAIALLQAGVAAVMPNYLQRLIASFFGAWALSAAMMGHGAGAVAPVLLTLAISLIWLGEARWGHRGMLLRPVGYGVTLALVLLEVQALRYHEFLAMLLAREGLLLRFPLWWGELLMGGLLVAVVGQLLSRRGEAWRSPRMGAALLAAALVAGASLEAPGIAAGFIIVLLGFANGNRVLLGLGIAASLFYVGSFYYSLAVTLLVKSGIMAVTGGALLVLRWVALRWVLPEESGHD